MHPLWIGILAGAQVAGVQLTDPSVFGRRTIESVRLLLDSKEGDAEPFAVYTDIRCGRYLGMTVHYRPEATEAAVKAALTGRHGAELLSSSGQPMGQWRVKDQFVITMGRVEDEFHPSIRVIYITPMLVSGRCPDGTAFKP